MVTEAKPCQMHDTEALDPQLWQELPKVLLEKVISKLPFTRAVAFRTVCNEWCTDIIPRIAPHAQASSGTVLLYFGQQEIERDDKKAKGYACWVQLCNSKSERRGRVKEFQQKSFPSPRSGEDVELMSCEQGLLFFGFQSRKDFTVRDIVACNPLMPRSKLLGLPCPLRPQQADLVHDRCKLAVGVVFDAKGASYRLVVAGVDGKGEHVTFLYNSYTSTWTSVSSMLPTLEETMTSLVYSVGRSVSCKGNLYWNVADKRDRKYVLKYELHQNTWVMTPEKVANCAGCLDGAFDSHLGTYSGPILIWHLNKSPQSSEVTDPTLSMYNPELDWAPEIKSMPEYMIEATDMFLASRPEVYTRWDCPSGRQKYSFYSAYSEEKSFFSVLRSTSRRFKEDSHVGLKIFIHNTKDNSYTDVPVVGLEKIFGLRSIHPWNVWSFSASLTSIP